MVLDTKQRHGDLFHLLEKSSLVLLVLHLISESGLSITVGGSTYIQNCKSFSYQSE